MNLEILRDTPPWDWPGDTAEQLEKALTDPATSCAERLTAAHLAGDSVVINDRLAGRLLQLVGDPEQPEDLRATAAIALGPALESADLSDFDDELDPPPISESTFETIKKTFQKIYSDQTVPMLVQRRLLEASVRAPQDWHAAAVRKAYRGGQRDWVLTAVFCMRYVSGFEAQIVETLGNPDPEIHREALLAAGEKEVKAAWPHISSLLLNPLTPRELLIAAINAAGSVDHERAPELLRGYLDSPDEEIEEAACESLATAEGAHDLEDDEGESEF